MVSVDVVAPEILPPSERFDPFLRQRYASVALPLAATEKLTELPGQTPAFTGLPAMVGGMQPLVTVVVTTD